MKTSTKVNIAWIILIVSIILLLAIFWITSWEVGLITTAVFSIIVSGGYLISNTK